MINTEVISIEDAEATIFRSAPQWDGMTTMALGDIKFSSLEGGKKLLQNFIETAQKEGVGAVLGPLNGDTWHAYRLIFETDGSAPFLLEPTSGAHDLQAFESTGFESVSMYLSAKSSLNTTVSEKPVSMQGVTVEAWNGENAEGLIQDLFNMSALAFQSNRFFTPITFESFLDIYQPMIPYLDKDHVLFARDGEGDLQGFLFGMPNLLAGGDDRSVILKTYASRMKGVGHLLADSYHRRCLDSGFETVIHALIHEDNSSRKRSEMHGTRIFRRYALMGRKV